VTPPIIFALLALSLSEVTMQRRWLFGNLSFYTAGLTYNPSAGTPQGKRQDKQINPPGF
jgi:hypothetical protein